MPLRSLLLPCLVALGCAQAEETKHACPTEIWAATIAEPPSGWEVLGGAKSDGGLRKLAAVAFTAGHPADMAYLRPSSGDSTSAVYDFSVTADEGIYLVCQYEAVTAVFHKDLGSDVRECEVGLNEERRIAVCR